MQISLLVGLYYKVYYVFLHCIHSNNNRGFPESQDFLRRATTRSATGQLSSCNYEFHVLTLITGIPALPILLCSYKSQGIANLYAATWQELSPIILYLYNNIVPASQRSVAITTIRYLFQFSTGKKSVFTTIVMQKFTANLLSLKFFATYVFLKYNKNTMQGKSVGNQH